MEMWFEVKNFGHYSSEEVWAMTLPYFQMTYHFAMKHMKTQAQIMGPYSMGVRF